MTTTKGKTMVDIARFDRALAWIAEHPEQHEQGSWLIKLDCGTGGCLAGHVMMQEYPDAQPDLISETLRDTGGFGTVVFDALLLADGTLLDVEQHAAELLGLNEGQRSLVFAPENDLPMLRALRNLLADDPEVDHQQMTEVAIRADTRERDHDEYEYDEYEYDDEDDDE